jgi:HEAT repeat protein
MSIITPSRADRLDALIQQFNAAPNRLSIENNERDAPMQEYACQIAESGPRGVRFLLKQLEGAHELRIRAILIALKVNVANQSPNMRKRVCEAARGLISDKRPMVVADAVDLLRSCSFRSVKSQVIKLLTHDSPFVVGSVLRYLSGLFPKEALPCLFEALRSSDPVVRQNGIDELDELGCTDALPAIRELTKDLNADVRMAADLAVKNLSSI